jgi:hypothetical protein
VQKKPQAHLPASGLVEKQSFQATLQAQEAPQQEVRQEQEVQPVAAQQATAEQAQEATQQEVRQEQEVQPGAAQQATAEQAGDSTQPEVRQEQQVQLGAVQQETPLAAQGPSEQARTVAVVVALATPWCRSLRPR